MQFTYRITEKEYVRAWKLKFKGGKRQNLFKKVLFWLFILVCLGLLWATLQEESQHSISHSSVPAVSSTEMQTAARSQPPKPKNTERELLVNVGPFILLIGIWVLMLFKLGPRTIGGIYRKDPAMQGEFAVNLTSDGITTRNTAGTYAETPWKIYEFWREGKGVVILALYSGGYSAISLANLSEPQRDELRSILTAALPKG